MSKITAYGAMTAPAPNDQLIIVDVDDISLAASGTDKRITVDNLTTVPVTTNATATGSLTLTVTGTMVFNLTVTGTLVLTLSGSGLTAGQEYSVTLYLATGGHGVTFSGVTWVGSSSAPTLISGFNVLTFTTVDQGTTWHGAAVTGAPVLPLSTSSGGTGLASAGNAGPFLASTGAGNPLALAGLIPPAPVQTSSFTATLGELNPFDATSGNITVTLPAGGFAGQLVGAKMVNTASSHTGTITPTAPDVIGRVTGWTSGSYSTSASLAIQGQGQVLAYNPAVTPGLVTVQTPSSSANLLISTSVAPFAAGQLVFFTAGTMPTGPISANTPYYVKTTSGPTSGVFTFTVASTSTGSGLIPTSAGSSINVMTCGNWTTVSNDLPLDQLDTRYSTSSGLSLQASTGTTPYTLLSSGSVPQTILSWTAPTDGQLHRVVIIAMQHVATTQVAGNIDASFTDPASGTDSTFLLMGSLSSGYKNVISPLFIAQASTITVVQQTLLTSGAGTLWCEIWGS